MFPRLWLFVPLEPRRRIQPVRCPPQGDLPEGGQIFAGKKVPHGLRGLPGAVNLPLPQPLQQIDRLQIHQLHLVGGVEYAVRDALRNRYTDDRGDLVVQAF